MADLVNQPTPEPTRKTSAAMIGGVSATTVSIVIGWVCRQFFHLGMPGEVQVALASLLIIGLSYFTKERAA